MSPPSFPILGSASSATAKAVAPSQLLTSPMISASNHTSPRDSVSTNCSEIGSTTSLARNISTPTHSPHPRSHTPSTLSPSPIVSATPSSSQDIQPHTALDTGADNYSGTFGKPNGLFPMSKQQATPRSESAGVTAHGCNVSTVATSHHTVQQPLFLPESPPPATISMPAPPEMAFATSPSNLVAPAKASKSPTYTHPSSDIYNVDDELLATAYGMEVGDTGFQTCEGTREPSGKPKSSKSPRQKKGTSPNKWAGGPGGAMKFGTKPEGYTEVLGQTARWSYSEDRIHSQDVHDRMWGDVHFCPALDDDDGPFVSWVRALAQNGEPRWVHFSAGQPHPQYGGYVFRPAQLPRMAPHWLKETSYKAVQLK
ncbi:hypothetical protein FS749_007967 [Ceratobasidium sp. UAMH 11750]|nr:hypothetical protein FS749_007967 [Ceratobasidium sp. UAMH 11750]